MNVLYVAYPLLPVSSESAGGAEQMLWTLEREMAARGHRTTVAACSASRVAGELFATGDAVQAVDGFDGRNREHNQRVVEFVTACEVRGKPFDIVHDKSGFFWSSARHFRTPVLATLHLPRHMYPGESFEGLPENLYFNCVSQAQAAAFADLPRMLGVVENGIALDRFEFAPSKSEYLLWIGRICEEKGPHLAIDAAMRVRMPLVLAGAVYPFSYHQQFYEREVAPRIAAASGLVRYIEHPSFDEKLRLLQHARAVLLTSTVNETSSLVAMEAMACGTPVVAFRSGAFPDVVADSETGFIVDTVEDMADALINIDAIDPTACRARVERCYSATRMTDDYERLYDRILADTVCSKQVTRERVELG